MKRADLERHLRHLGCEVKREGAKHTIWHNTSTGQWATVARHRELPLTTVRAICAQLDIDPTLRRRNRLGGRHLSGRTAKRTRPAPRESRPPQAPSAPLASQGSVIAYVDESLRRMGRACTWWQPW